MRKAKLILFLVVVVLLGVAAFYLFGSYSEGFRAGTVIKLSRKGMAMKTYEGQLNLGMVLSDQPGGATVSNIWDFSVPGSRKETIERLEKAMLNGQRVKLHYKEKFVTLPWRGDTKYMVYDVEEQ
jgi:hypothetical protein